MKTKQEHGYEQRVNDTYKTTVGRCKLNLEANKQDTFSRKLLGSNPPLLQPFPLGVDTAHGALLTQLNGPPQSAHIQMIKGQI